MMVEAFMRQTTSHQMVFQGVVYDFGFGLTVQFLHKPRLVSRHGLDREV